MRELIFLFSILISSAAFGQSEISIQIPTHGDRYSEFVKMLEEGHLDIDYKALRESFIESEQFKIASRKKTIFDSLKRVMYGEMEKRNHPEIILITKQLLSIDYTSMIAHKMLRQTYQLLGDTANATKYKTIQFGLLNSIVKNGDGKTCATGWPVVQIEEEYFILQMLGAKLNRQSTDYKGGVCDKMDVNVDGERRIYYFDISKVFQSYKQLGLY